VRIREYDGAGDAVSA